MEAVLASAGALVRRLEGATIANVFLFFKLRVCERVPTLRSTKLGIFVPTLPANDIEGRVGTKMPAFVERRVGTPDLKGDNQVSEAAK